MARSEGQRRQRRHQETRRKMRRRLEEAGVPEHLILQHLERLRARQKAARTAQVTLVELEALHDETHAALRLDDKGYKPDPGDSVLRGAARATGNTAKAVKAGKTFTKYQLDRQEDSA